MIRIAISAEAFAAIEATMQLGSVAVEPAANDRSEREIWLDEGSSTACWTMVLTGWSKCDPAIHATAIIQAARAACGP